MRGKKVRRMIRYGVIGLGLGVLIGVAEYEEENIGSPEARLLFVGVPIAGLLLAHWRNRRMA